MIERIRARRDALMRDVARAKRQYDELDRQICMMAGGLAELNALLDADPEERIGTYETGLNGAHAATLEGET